MRHPAALLLLLIFAPLAWAADDVAVLRCAGQHGAKVVSLQGTLEYDPESKGRWIPIQLNQTLCEGSRIHVGMFSRASLLLPNGFVARIDEDTVLTFNVLNPEKTTLMDLLKGFVHFISRTPKHLQINTPIANAGPEGTEFALSANDKSASLWVYEGGVKFFNTAGSLHLSPGQGAQAYPGQAPQPRIDISPQDAVNWALYYPPLVPYPEPLQTIDNDIRIAILDFRQGRVAAAITRLDTLPLAKKTLFFYKVRGAMLLTVGRTDLARQDIQAILKQNANDAEALALQSVLALTQNRKVEAYAFANRATTANPSSSAAYSALSYAEQGRFELKNALKAAGQAVINAPHDALMWARKAELELALGLTSASQDSVAEAEKRDAELERTQTVIGFTHLQQMDAKEAKQAFDKALQLDSTSPLARLGLGLAKIRNGDLAEGRQDLEIAATLDPDNSLIRSYLGKAYYEENRNLLAEDQFKLAKERDPKDPTPYFYDALKKQTENRTVEALHELQKAIALNDNRAVYRSKQLLDSDRATRGASLARIYDTLGFDQRGILEASSSLADDPTNYSAHRFLSDSYVRFPARGAAQSSELLQAQLLQPININPIQPHLAISNRSLPIGLAVSEPLFRDFTRLFERNRPQFTASGIYGNLDTAGDEAVLSGINNNFSYSFGQFHFASDGFRSNAGVNHDVYNAFIQSAFSENLNAQFQYLHRETKQGDLTQLFDPTFSHDEHFYLNQDVIRGGIHYQPANNISLIATVANLPINEKIYRPGRGITEHKNSGWNGDIQMIWKNDKINVLIGGNAYEKRIHTTDSDDPNNIQFQVKEGNSFYGYSYVKFPLNITGTFGFNYTYLNSIDYGSLKTIEPYSRWQPKLGMQWQPLENLTLRFAYAKSLKPSLFSDQSIEPTQIAGFNQLFDDLNGDESTLYASVIDWKWSNFIYAGFHFSRRDIDKIEFIRSNNEILSTKLLPKRQADSYTAYFNWLISDSFSLTAQYVHERDSIFNFEEGGEFLTTNKAPLFIRYFNSNGLFSQLGITYVSQNNVNSNLFSPFVGSQSFILADAAIGYRLPKRLGLISLEVRNIFDKSFNYNDKWLIEQSDLFQMARQQEFLPTRTIFGRVFINF